MRARVVLCSGSHSRVSNRQGGVNVQSFDSLNARFCGEVCFVFEASRQSTGCSCICMVTL